MPFKFDAELLVAAEGALVNINSQLKNLNIQLNTVHTLLSCGEGEVSGSFTYQISDWQQQLSAIALKILRHSESIGEFRRFEIEKRS